MSNACCCHKQPLCSEGLSNSWHWKDAFIIVANPPLDPALNVIHVYFPDFMVCVEPMTMTPRIAKDKKVFPFYFPSAPVIFLLQSL